MLVVGLGPLSKSYGAGSSWRLAFCLFGRIWEVAKQEPRPAIHMEKQLEWALYRWEGVTGDLQGSANSVRQVDGVSDMAPACWPCSCVGGRAQKKGSGLCLPLCPPSSCLDARYFIFSLPATGAVQAATPVLELRGSETE